MAPRTSFRSARLLAVGVTLLATCTLAACGSDAASTADADPAATVVALTEPATTTAAPTTLAPTTVAATVPATTQPATTVVEPTLPPTTLPATTLPATTLPPTVAPVTVVTTDPCVLLTTLEVAYAFGGDAQSPTSQSDVTGTGTTCIWRLDADEATQLRVAIVPSVTNDPAAGWPVGSSATSIDGLGDASAIAVQDNDVRIGFVRGGVTVVVQALVAASTAPTWVELARQLDARLGGQAPLPSA